MHARGFTLIELVVVILLTAAVAALAGRNVTGPVLGFVDTSRRAALVDAGHTAITRITREVRLALPNSVRIDGGNALEFLRTRTGGRYRVAADPALPLSDPLEFSGGDTRFDVLGALRAFGRICAGTSPSCGGPAASTAACMADPRLDCLVVYNTGQPADCSLLPSGRTNAYCGDNVAGIDVADSGAGTLAFVIDGGAFPLASPNQRFHVVDTPVSYLCDLGTRTLRRYDGYPIGATQPSVASPPPVSGRVLATDVTDCEFSYDPGTATRAALVAVRLTLADADAPGERIVLYQQAHVANTP
ncbi:MAG: prepilin-type N-terminal cleavage/methylation domain-containing protein [Gammaproteobacteria bacterium]|nr:prepilin-type N-terminal cleavage/methylation domain-containing protein [Gammaproteobacteria bacterium]MCP5199293.1 prepilin-type N-terminal cleavage/methylation domain-containing protein [Gammaproteobacteria bacterium]